MKRAFITHITNDYLDVAVNLANSIELFSNLPLIIYVIDLNKNELSKFDGLKNIQIRNIQVDIPEKNVSDYEISSSGNFYINRESDRIYKILCSKTIAMEMALEEGIEEICYLDSDCLATPFVDQLFDWSKIITDYPIATKGIHEYMIKIENGKQCGNPFEFTWPIADNKLSLEWPLMQFLEISENERGTYRTTGIMIMNRNCLPFIRTWREFCFILPKLVNIKKYAPFHEETIYNVLSWKKGNIGFPLCYINIADGLKTVNHFYTEGVEGYQSWDEVDTSKRFYKIPDDKKNIKVLHGEKRTSEVNMILKYLQELKSSNYFNNV